VSFMTSGRRTLTANRSFRELVPQLLGGSLQCSASQQSLAEAKLALVSDQGGCR
jgi:hypothetical protein